jgi:hypothetical protein
MSKLLFGVTVALGLLFGAVQTQAAGAIAVDDEAGAKADEVGYGIGSGDTREEAAVEAKRQCKKAGNSDCKVVVRYDTCGAYAASSNYSGTGWGSSEAAARRNALDACGSGCRIVVSDCQ